MTRAAYQSMFVFLSGALLAALFVLQPSDVPEVRAMQTDIREQFASAADDLLDQTLAQAESSLALVWNGVDSFYRESSRQTAAVLQPTQAMLDMILVWDEDYQADMAYAFAPRVTRPLALGDPVLNIIPMGDPEALLDPDFSEDLAFLEPDADGPAGRVAGESVEIREFPPVAAAVSWMDIRDSITGAPYCVAVFNGTVNSYPGKCAVSETRPVYAN